MPPSKAKSLVPGPQAYEWARVFSDLSSQHGLRPLVVDGKLPLDLAGTLYRVGPALFSSYGRRFGHWFDGDGAISSVRFHGGKASGAARIIETPSLTEERRAGRPVYGSYGTVSPGNWFTRMRPRIKNASNTHALLWQKRLFTLYDSGLPVEIDPDTLATLGETDLAGVIPQYFCAHPHRVPQRRATYNIGVRPGRRTEIDVFELPDVGAPRRLTVIKMPGVAIVHDFIATPKHLILFSPPFKLKLLPQILGTAAVSDNLVWAPELGTEVIVLPFDQMDKPTRFRVEGFFQWHYCNAFEEGGEIVVDFVRHPDFSSNQMLNEQMNGCQITPPKGKFARARIAPAQKRLSWEPCGDFNCEFPRIAPVGESQGYRFAYVNAQLSPPHPQRPYQSIVKLEVATQKVASFTFPDGQYPNEPIFVPRAAAQSEDDGYLLTLVYDGASHTSHVAVLDAQSIELGPVARAHFDHHIPFTFHGAWVP